MSGCLAFDLLPPAKAALSRLSTRRRRHACRSWRAAWRCDEHDRGSRDFDVVIVGAGVIGAAMASLLLARKLCAPGRVAMVADRFARRRPADADWDLRVFALSRASERLLRACGVWQSLPAQRMFRLRAHVRLGCRRASRAERVR